MYATANAGERAKWEVMWPVVKKGRLRWVRKDFGADLSGALTLYTRAVEGGRKATLRCKNMSFPPPDDYADVNYEIVKRKGKKYKRNLGVMIPRRYDVKMHAINLKGMFWCPFCMKFRKFTRQDREGGTVMACPACGASHIMAQVRKYNPAARSMSTAPLRRTRSDKGKRRR